MPVPPSLSCAACRHRHSLAQVCVSSVFVCVCLCMSVFVCVLGVFFLRCLT